MDKYTDLIKKYLNVEIDLGCLLSELPSDKERLFEVHIINLITKGNHLEEESYKILKDINSKEEIAYKAFYLLCSIYRRRKDTTEYGELFELYGRRFEINDSYGYLKSMYLAQTGIEENIELAVGLAYNSYQKVPNNIGIKHCYCDIVAEAFEEKIFNVKDRSEELEKAIRAIEEVINYSEGDYAKFYCTYGRILALKGEFKRAKIQIKKAIDKEKSDRVDYSLRIGEYMKYAMSISSYEQTVEIEKKIKESSMKIAEFNNKVDSTLSKNIEFLGFFAALVSFVIASVQMLSKQDFNEAVKLIVVLGGVQMLVVGSFSIMLSGKNDIKRSIVIFIMAIITILVGMKVI